VKGLDSPMACPMGMRAGLYLVSLPVSLDLVKIFASPREAGHHVMQG